MEVKYLSFANMTLRLLLPEEMLETQKYESFFCKEKPSDFTVEYSFSQSTLSLPKNNLQTLSFEDKVIVCGENGYDVFYKNAFGGFYAQRNIRGDSNVIKVTLTPEAEGKLWARLVLNTMGVEELAAKKNAFVFHSSFIMRDNKAILFTGPCGIGKSTQARLWSEFKDTPVINGDKTMIYFEDNTVYASGLPFSGSSGICKNKAAPLEMIVKLTQGKNNKTQKLSKKEAFSALLKSIYIPSGLGEQIAALAVKTAAMIPIVAFECTPDNSAVEALEKFIIEEERL